VIGRQSEGIEDGAADSSLTAIRAIAAHPKPIRNDDKDFDKRSFVPLRISFPGNH
jgi:hypothetical protein